MTASAQKRQRNTWLALGAAVVALVLVIALGVAGARTLANSTVGRRVGAETETSPSQRLANTPTALVGTVDEMGRLTSVAVLVIEPDGAGGAIVTLSASADTGFGGGTELRPLAAMLEVNGPEAFLLGAEGLSGLSFDVVELVDAARFSQLIAPVGDLDVRVPVAFHDASSRRSWERGDTTMSSAEASAAVVATDPAIADWYFDPVRSAVWEAVAERVGAGIGSVPAVDSEDDVPTPQDLDAFTDRLFADRVDFRQLSFEPVDDERTDEALSPGLRDAFGPDAVPSVVLHDPAESLMVFASLAPARMGKPREAPSVRLVGGFPDEALEEFGVNGTDATLVAVNRLLFGQTNVISVVLDEDRDVPELTVIRVADPDRVLALEETFGDFLGPTNYVAADVVVDGVDLEIVLGESFLDNAFSEGDGDGDEGAGS